MTRIACIASYKGGVGKTTLASIVASTLSERFHKKVLIVDADPQANITEVFISPRDFDKIVEYAERHGKKFSLEWITSSGDPLIYRSTNNLYIIPSRPEYIGLAKFIMVPAERLVELRKEFEARAQEYDYVILDLPPQMYGLIGPLIKLSDVLVTPVMKTSFALTALYYLIKDTFSIPPTDKPIFIGAVLTRFRRNEVAGIALYRKRTERIVEEAYRALGMKWNLEGKLPLPTFKEILYAHPKLADIRSLPYDSSENIRLLRLIRGELRYSEQVIEFTEPLTKEFIERIEMVVQ